MEKKREGAAELSMEKLEIEESKDESGLNYRGIKAMPFVVGNEAFEKLGTIGTLSNLLVYLTKVFGLSTIAATNLLNIFNGTANLATLLGAFLSDSYFGRYNTLAFSCVASFLGMVVLTLTAAVHRLHPSHHEGPTRAQKAVLGSGLFLLVVGAGGIRPCNLAFGADQFNPETASGKRGMTSFFNWYYFTFTFAMMVSMTFIVYVQSSISWAVGLAIPALLMLVSCSVFFMGTRIYVRVTPEGSPLVSVVQVVAAAVKKRKLRVEGGGCLLDYVPRKYNNSMIPHTGQFRFLNKGAIITEEDRINPDGSATDPWRLCSMQQVEEVKCLLRVIPIWVSGIIYSIVPVILNTYVIFQALQSNRHLSTTSFQIPAASYMFFNMLAVTIWLPIYDRAIVPFLRKITGKDSGITLLQKMGVGMVLNVVTMLVAAYIEHERREVAIRRGMTMSGFWLVPQLAISGLSEAFALVGFVEFYYKQVPEGMKSIGASFLYSAMAVSNYLSSFLISVVHKVTSDEGSGSRSWLSEDLNKGGLDKFYYLVAGLELVNLFYFLVCAKWYKYKGKSDDNEADQSVVQTEEGKPDV